MDHEANFTGIGSPINIDINSVCETRCRSSSSSACTSGDDEKSSEEKDEEEKEEKIVDCVTGNKFAESSHIFDEMNNERDIASLARNEKIWREHQIIDDENLKVRNPLN